MVLSNRMKPSIFVLFVTFCFLTDDEMIMTNAKLRANFRFLDHITDSFVFFFFLIVRLKTRSSALSLSNSYSDMLHAFLRFLI